MSRVRVPIEQMLEKANQSGDHPGLKCTRCHCVQFGPGHKVRNTVNMKDGSIKRYRQCRNCGHVWVTHER